MNKKLLLVGPASLLPLLLVASPATADTERCSTHGEYDQIEVAMSVGTVQRIFDVAGVWGEGGPGTFVRRFRSCQGDARFVIVFGNDTGLSEGKRVVDL